MSSSPEDASRADRGRIGPPGPASGGRRWVGLVRRAACRVPAQRGAASSGAAAWDMWGAVLYGPAGRQGVPDGACFRYVRAGAGVFAPGERVCGGRRELECGGEGVGSSSAMEDPTVATATQIHERSSAARGKCSCFPLA